MFHKLFQTHFHFSFAVLIHIEGTLVKITYPCSHMRVHTLTNGTLFQSGGICGNKIKHYWVGSNIMHRKNCLTGIYSLKFILKHVYVPTLFLSNFTFCLFSSLCTLISEIFAGRNFHDFAFFWLDRKNKFPQKCAIFV